MASETCAFDLIDAEFVREVEPGEIIVVNDKGLTSHHPFILPETPAKCVFEYVYFARPDSKIFGNSAVYPVRKALGRQLSKEAYIQADMVVPVEQSKLEFFGFGEGNRVFVGEAGVAVMIVAAWDGIEHALQTQVGQTVGSDVFTDFLDRMAGANQFFLGGRVNPIKTRLQHHLPHQGFTHDVEEVLLEPVSSSFGLT